MSKTSRLYPERPIPGVAGIVLNGNHVLLAQRGNEPSKGKWGIPGGVVEVGETLEEAVVREVREETGVVCKPVRLVTVFDSVNRDGEGKPCYHYVLFEYLCEYVSGEVVPSSDCPDARWVSLDDLDSVDIMRSTRRFIVNTLGL